MQALHFPKRHNTHRTYTVDLMANDLHIELEMLRDLTLVTLVACSLQAARPAAAYLALTPRSCRFQPRAGASMPTAVPTYEKAKAAVDKVRVRTVGA